MQKLPASEPVPPPVCRFPSEIRQWQIVPNVVHTTYTYRVVAIDLAGLRSGTAVVRLITPGNSAVAAPTGLRGEVYSTLAGEIFWDRPATFGLVYEVRRDGELLTTTDGMSYFDDQLAAGRSYTYEVVAIDRQARRSPVSSVTLTTLGGAPMGPTGPVEPIDPAEPGGDPAEPPGLPSPITLDNAEELVDYVFEVYTGRAFGREILALPRYPFAELDAMLPPLQMSEETRTLADVACENGGTLDNSNDLFGTRQKTMTRTYAFDDCQRGGTLYDGAFTQKDFGNFSGNSEGLIVDEPNRRIAFSGAFDYKFRNNRDGALSRNYALDDVDLEISNGQSVTLREATFRYDYTVAGFFFGVEGGFTAVSEQTAFREITATIEVPFEYELGEDPAFVEDERPDSVRFQTGRLVVSDTDGNRIVLIGDNGDPVTVTIEFTTRGGVTERFDAPWSIWAETLEFPFDLATLPAGPSSSSWTRTGATSPHRAPP